ncbi:hypothetical protein [Cellulomonas fimi]|uniref:Uncharacterized protein n=1 Tax=Cellulomonas fimi TaxID=1708 RepID=A0A7Y0QFZ1_CELFI|nr:hypothetical protein [Cellulomonas fimi]NMR19546.1 hypothetical protein [Cellulomonas fimi]
MPGPDVDPPVVIIAPTDPVGAAPTGTRRLLGDDPVTPQLQLPVTVLVCLAASAWRPLARTLDGLAR